MNGLKLLAETFGREEVDGFSDGPGLVGDGADGESRNGEDGGASRFHVANPDLLLGEWAMVVAKPHSHGSFI